MIVHWGDCPVKAMEAQHIDCHKELMKEVNLLVIKLDSLALHESDLLKQNDELRKAHTLLEGNIQKYQEKIQHLQDTISDYSKADLLERAPVYIELSEMPQPEKAKRKSR